MALRALSEATDRIYAMHAMWPNNVLDVTEKLKILFTGVNSNSL